MASALSQVAGAPGFVFLPPRKLGGRRQSPAACQDWALDQRLGSPCFASQPQRARVPECRGWEGGKVAAAVLGPREQGKPSRLRRWKPVRCPAVHASPVEERHESLSHHPASKEIGAQGSGSLTSTPESSPVGQADNSMHEPSEAGLRSENGTPDGAQAVSASAAEVVRGGDELPPDFWEDTFLPSTTRRDLEAASPLQSFLFPDKEELPDDVEMSIWDHLEELRQRVFVSVGAVGVAILGCFAYANQLVQFLEAPVKSTGVRFLQLSPGEYFFVTLKVAGYTGLLLGSPVILYEIIAFVLPGLTRNERRFLGPIVLGSSVLFYAGLAFSYNVLVPAALNFFVTYAENVVESIWSIDQYFEFVLVLLFSTGLSFQVPVIQLLLGSTGLFSSDQMFSVWKYVVVGAVVAAAVLTPSTDPLTQILLAGPLIGLYFGGAAAVRLTEKAKGAT